MEVWLLFILYRLCNYFVHLNRAGISLKHCGYCINGHACWVPGKLALALGVHVLDRSCSALGLGADVLEVNISFEAIVCGLLALGCESARFLTRSPARFTRPVCGVSCVHVSISEYQS